MYVRKKLFVLFRCCSTAFNSVVLTKLHFFKALCSIVAVIIAAMAVLVVQLYSQEC